MENHAPLLLGLVGFVANTNPKINLPDFSFQDYIIVWYNFKYLKFYHTNPWIETCHETSLYARFNRLSSLYLGWYHRIYRDLSWDISLCLGWHHSIHRDMSWDISLCLGWHHSIHRDLSWDISLCLEWQHSIHRDLSWDISLCLGWHHKIDTLENTQYNMDKIVLLYYLVIVMIY